MNLKQNYFFRIATFDHEQEPGHTIGFQPGDRLVAAIGFADDEVKSSNHVACTVVYRCTMGYQEIGNYMPVEVEIHRAYPPKEDEAQRSVEREIEAGTRAELIASRGEPS